jgi:chemotaxis protein MotB
MADDKPIIIIKKKGGHGGHHGGAWKVAYADFVTAMMAFFMVMWLVNSAADPIKQNIASYFRKPGIFEAGSGTPLMIGASGILPDAPPPKPDEKKNSVGSAMAVLAKRSGNDDGEKLKRLTQSGQKEKGDGTERGKGLTEPEDPSELEKENFTSFGINLEKEDMLKVAEQIQAEITQNPELSDLLGILDVKLEADGLNIEIMDTEHSSMFTMGSARIQPEAEQAFRKLGKILAKTTNAIDIVGHTDAKPFPGKINGYSNWELSSDRANAARRLLLGEGVTSERIGSVVGRAEKDLRKKDAPLDPSNRRITLKMRFKKDLSISLPKNPDALNDLAPDEAAYEKANDERVHSLSSKDVLSPLKKRKKNVKTAPTPVPLLDPLTTNPVIGPTDHFANF